MKKIIMTVLLIFALLAVPVMADDKHYEKIGSVMNDFIDKLTVSNRMVDELPRYIHTDNMTFKLTDVSKSSAVYVDVEGFYKVKIISENGNLALDGDLTFKLNNSDFKFTLPEFVRYIEDADGFIYLEAASADVKYCITRL